MVSDVSAMMNTVSQASNRPSSERPQQTDSYHDMMKNMLKEQKRIKEEKKPGSDNDSTKVNAKEKPNKDEKERNLQRQTAVLYFCRREMVNSNLFSGCSSLRQWETRFLKPGFSLLTKEMLRRLWLKCRQRQ